MTKNADILVGVWLTHSMTRIRTVYPLTVQPVGRGETSLYYIAYLDAMSKFDSIERERLF